MAKKELNLKSYFSKKVTVTEPLVASTSRHEVEMMPGASGPSQDSSLEREQVEDSSDTVISLQPSKSPQGCSCQCCTNPEVPYRPSDVSDSKVCHAHHSKDKRVGQKKCYDRKIQPNWFMKYPWISVCTSTFRIFCATCRGAKKFGQLTLSKHQKSAFVEDGFGNWKKGLQKFLEHEKSDMHREAADRLAAKSSGRNVATLLNTQHEVETVFHRELLLKLLSCIQFLARQGLPFRGHRENADCFEGNLYQLLLLQALNFPQMEMWLRQREYISPEIINEVIMMMGQAVLREILTEIKRSYWFALIADKASDLTNHFQCN